MQLFMLLCLNWNKSRVGVLYQCLRVQPINLFITRMSPSNDHKGESQIQRDPRISSFKKFLNLFYLVLDTILRKNERTDIGITAHYVFLHGNVYRSCTRNECRVFTPNDRQSGDAHAILQQPWRTPGLNGSANGRRRSW